VIYGALLAAAVTSFVVALAVRVPFELRVSHNASSLSAALADGRAGNAYTLRIENRARQARDFALALDAPAGFDLLAGESLIRLEPTSSLELRIFVAAPPAAADARPAQIAFSLSDVARPERRVRRGTTFVYASAGARNGR